MPRKSRKAASALIHPAILALRAAHAEYAATHACSSLFASDLVHDERTILAQPKDAFGWIIHGYGTYYINAASEPGAARAQFTTKRSGTGLTPHVVAQTYRGDNDLRYFFWDGSALSICAGPEALNASLQAARAAAIIADIERKLVLAREDLAAAGPDGIWHERCAEQVATLEREIAELRTSTEES